MFFVDPQIANHSIWLYDSDLSSVFLKNEAQFPWLILVPRVADIREIHQLSPKDQQQLMQEMTRFASIMEKACQAEKINIGALGNIVPQLHIHIIARFKTDIAWPHSVWQAGITPQPLEAAALEQQVTFWRQLL